ncbi:MAG: hypothetical protein IH898_03310 [Planctomycetes bacterium]|nr:hypothetical protein [Planctomycetota bacterium]
MSDANSYKSLDDELLSAHVDGELTEAERTAVEQRLRDDPQARELVAELRRVSETLRSLPKHELGADLREAVLQEAVVHTERAPAEGGWTRRWAWATLALAAALLLTVYLPETNRDEQPLAGALPKAQAPSLEREEELTVPQLQAGAKQETFDLGLIAESLSAPSPVSSGLLEGSVEFQAEADRAAAADSIALGAVIDGTLRSAPIQSPHIQPIGELRAEDYHVHLTPVDRRVGAAQFDQLLVSHGIAVRSDSSVFPDRGSGAPAQHADVSDADDKVNKNIADEPAAGEAELVLVEAPLEQIQQIVASCSGDDSPWKTLRLVDQDGTKSSLLFFAHQKPKAAGPAEAGTEAGVAVALDGLQLADAPARAASGWAKHLGRDRVAPGQSMSTEAKFLRKRNLATLKSRAADQRVDLEQRPMATIRVLFILHPAE